MKNGKRPTVDQRKLIQAKGLNSDNWLVVKNTPEMMLIQNRQSLRTREIKKEGT